MSTTSAETPQSVEDATTRLMSALALHEEFRDTVRDALLDAYETGRDSAAEGIETR